jgi:hypothetical protein
MVTCDMGADEPPLRVHPEDRHHEVVERWKGMCRARETVRLDAGPVRPDAPQCNIHLDLEIIVRKSGRPAVEPPFYYWAVCRGTGVLSHGWTHTQTQAENAALVAISNLMRPCPTNR